MKYSIKTIATSLLLICIAHASTKAQDSNPVRFGIKGGVNFSSLYTKDVEETKMRTGFNVGLFAKLPLTDYFAVQPELYYTTKGAEITYNNTFVNGTAGFHLNYIEVPLMFVGNITANFNIHAGPYAAFLISGKVKNESNIDFFDFEENIDTDDYNTFEAGLAIGAGIDLKAVSLGVRYNHGLTNVGKERTFLGTTYTFPDATNGVINLYISLSLN
ncbi:MAG: porin family protein [Bacteroidia bacterium]